MDIFVGNQGGLSCDLGTNLVMWKTVSREEWNFLTSSNRVHYIDRGNTSLDHFLWIDSPVWINWLSLDIKELFSENWRTLIDWLSGTVESSSKHFFGNWHFENITSELDMGVKIIDSGSSFEDLDDSALAIDFEYLTLSDASISQDHVNDFCVP